MKKGIFSLLFLALFAIGTTVPGFAADKGLARKDTAFVKKAAMGGMMEVQAGQLAQQQANSQEVKDFGGRMVTDHGKANDELKALAQQKNVTLPANLEGKHKRMVDKLKKLSGAEFDKAYMKDMVDDHVKDVAEFQKAQKSVKDPDLQAWIGKTLPVLQEHLQQAKDVAQKVGAKTGK